MPLTLWKCDDGTYDVVNKCECCGYGAIDYCNLTESQLATAPTLYGQLKIAQYLLIEAFGLLDDSTGLSAEFEKRARDQLKKIQVALARYDGAL